jgi:predicted TIM-barrel fold metal-dependent hydrolase
MRTSIKKLIIIIFIAGAVIAAAERAARVPLLFAASETSQGQIAYSTGLLQQFAAINPVDVHVHAFKSDAEITNLMTQLHLRVLDICVADRHGIYADLPTETARAKDFVQNSRNHARLCVTFSPFEFQQKDFAQTTIQQLRKDFAEGAIAVKIWKNIGMELTRPDGSYVMPDDPVFQPIYRAIQEQNKTLIAHVAEPSSCWQPPNPDSPDYDYYKENPQWYMYLHPDHPRKEVILAARDHLLADNPKLRVVGAHLGSMETDVDEIAKRFDRYPNFAVDTAARMEYLMIQPRDKVRNFLIKYSDRVLYGTDLEFLANESVADALKDWQDTYSRDWKFLATDQMLEYHGRQIKGLNLPPPVLQRIFHDNAAHWIPGIVATSE